LLLLPLLFLFFLFVVSLRVVEENEEEKLADDIRGLAQGMAKPLVQLNRRHEAQESSCASASGRTSSSTCSATAGHSDTSGYNSERNNEKKRRKSKGVPSSPTEHGATTRGTYDGSERSVGKSKLEREGETDRERERQIERRGDRSRVSFSQTFYKITLVPFVRVFYCFEFHLSGCSCVGEPFFVLLFCFLFTSCFIVSSFLRVHRNGLPDLPMFYSF
jgi:hypothetical protein